MCERGTLSCGQSVSPVPQLERNHESAETVAPLCIDLDGTLIRTDLLLESLLLLIRQSFWHVFLVPFWLLAGKAAFKDQIARRVRLDAAALPYNQDLVAWIRDQKALGRRIVLATASHRRFAESVAEHLGCFDEVIASDQSANLSGDSKLRALNERFGERGFDYAGNSSKDVCIWAGCRLSVVVHASKATLHRAQAAGPVQQIFPKPKTKLKTWLRGLRVHQWVKNILVFIPLFTSHHLSDIHAIKAAIVLFFAFCSCASVIYIVNDLLDLPADRVHATKSRRPFASGDLSIPQGAVLALLFATISIGLASFLPPPAQFILATYFVLTSLYSVVLKTKLILDVLTLASLYTVRIFAGGLATHIRLSGWLITFSLFFFLSLAICKRSSELINLVQANRTRTSGRFYEISDLEPLNICGISSGMLACFIILLYEGSQQAQSLYATPQLLVLLCPLLFYWVSRLWVLTFRGALKEDPILFAVRDRVSYAVCFAMAAIVVAAAFVHVPLERFLQ
ncbi:MAG: UbiA family prenyltransferase [Acidobacteriia bacterium]|nr:UbiA family prenyltransferase [Terriglobia bacterium]